MRWPIEWKDHKLASLIMHILWFLGLVPNPQTFWVKHVGFILTLGHKTELGDFFQKKYFSVKEWILDWLKYSCRIHQIYRGKLDGLSKSFQVPCFMNSSNDFYWDKEKKNTKNLKKNQAVRKIIFDTSILAFWNALWFIKKGKKTT